jgi:CHAT domain-containing protein/tetratricopeptide (TPR) repeat protein
MTVRHFVPLLSVFLLCAPLLNAQESSPRILSLQRTAPPSIHDVVAQLRLGDTDKAEMEQKNRLLGEELPEGATPTERISFLVLRAAAAEDVGNLPRRLADLKEIARLAQGSRNEVTHIYNLGLAEVLYGDLPTGMRALQRVLDLLQYSTQSWGLMINSHSILAYINAEMGQMDQTEDHLNKAQGLLGRIKTNSGGMSGFIPSWEMMVNFADGRTKVARGKWVAAEAALRRAVAHSEESAANVDKLVGLSKNNALQSNMLAGRNLIGAELARHLMRQGKFDEAELFLRDMLTVNLQRVGRYSVRTAMTLIQLADLLAARGRSDEAWKILDEVQDISRFMGVGKSNRITLGMAQTRVNLHLGQEDWRNAVADEDAFRGRVDSQGLSRLNLLSPGLAIALIHSSRAAEANQRLEQYIAERVFAMGERHYEVAEARGVQAMALAALGNRQAARIQYSKASAQLLEYRGLDSEAQMRSMGALVRRLVLEAYLDFLADEPADSGAAATAFRIADALHIGKTQQALAQSAARAAARQEGLGDLVRIEQDGKAEQLTLYSQLLRLTALAPELQPPQVMAAMRQRIGALDKELLQFDATLERRFPAYANLVHPRPPTIEEVKEVLKPDEALINIFATHQATYVWAFRREGQPAFVRVPLTHQSISRMVQGLRRAVDPGDVDITRNLPAFDLDTAHRLYLALLQPVASVWRGADSLLVITNGALSQLPLALLPTAQTTLESDTALRYASYQKVRWLVRETALTQLPSANALVTLRRLLPGNAKRQAFIGFGDPDFAGNGGATAISVRGLRNLAPARFSAPQGRASNASWMPYGDIPALPDTRDEILALARVLKANLERDVFLGRDASKARVKQADLAQSRVVAFATHGLLSGEFPGVDQPSLALANPGNGQHGLLTLEEILSLRLDADWVVLSACNTAAGDGLGAEALSGLGRGFFYAGTRALLATHWPVESASARVLVTGTFTNQAADPALSRAQALRKSMLVLMEQKSEYGFSYAHPLFWAPYALIGDGGR